MKKADHTPEEKKVKKKLPLWGKLLIGIGAAVVVVVAVIAVLGLNLLSRLTRPDVSPIPSHTPLIAAETTGSSLETPSSDVSASVTPVPASDASSTTLPLEDVYAQTRLDGAVLDTMELNRDDARFINVLLIGADRRGTAGNSNSDVMMIATIDKLHGSLKLTTLMRDMLVDIPGMGYGKLNSAASSGGYELLMQTINQNFRLDITQYVMVDFNMFEDIVDEIGGVTIYMTAEEISAANDCIAGLNKQRGLTDLWDGFIFAEEGNVKLNGKQALGYARIRHIDSDFSRTERQFKLLNTMYSKFMRLGVTKQYQLLYDFLPLIETNMANDAILTACIYALNMKSDGLAYFRVPADDMYKSGRYDRKAVLLVDIPANAWALHQFIYESDDAGSGEPELEPGKSLPPRTQSPEWMWATPTPYYDPSLYYQDAEGNLLPIDPGATVDLDG